jgi:regulator of sirC expression with transglutaminase-like and TPR domain
LAYTDLLQAKVDLDRTVDSSIAPADVKQEVMKLTAAARTFAGPHPSVGAQFDAVRKVLYQPGAWNDNRPFAYDQSDPLGEKIQHKLLSEYLKTRLGNCVTMPTLFMIVGRGIGLHLTLTDAPLHVLVRYTHPGLPVLNIEATSGGGFARDTWYQQQLKISDRAVQSGLYLRTHSDRETIALMATTVLDYLLSVGRNEDAIKVADAILAADPKDGYAMVKKGTAIASIMKAEFNDKDPTTALIPADLRPRYLELATANKKAFDDAEALGWEQPNL